VWVFVFSLSIHSPISPFADPEAKANGKFIRRSWMYVVVLSYLFQEGSLSYDGGGKRSFEGRLD
jgi:hypothetical protein